MQIPILHHRFHPPATTSPNPLNNSISNTLPICTTCVFVAGYEWGQVCKHIWIESGISPKIAATF